MRILIADDHSLIREGLRKILMEAMPLAEVQDVADSADLFKTSEVAEVLAGSLEQKDQRAPHEQLSDREFEVFKMIVMGKSISEIGDILSLNVNTISTYRARIMDKMKLHNNAELVKYAIQNNIV